MIRNIKLTIEYDGTNYCGWQVQNRRVGGLEVLRSIQDVIEGVLRKVLGEKIKLIASGRTDAGVHALAQTANFKTHSALAAFRLKGALNALLPADIAVSDVEEVSPDFHSRFKARAKLYRYTILNRPYPSALLRNRVYFCPYKLDIRIMRQEAKELLGRHNFKAFCASGSKVKDTVRTIQRISISCLHSEALVIIDIEADGFLYNMARNICGTLIEIGRGRAALGSLKKILLSKDRRLAGQTAPARGLCLVRVKY